MNADALRTAIPVLLLSITGCGSHRDGIVAFQSNRDGNFEVYTMNGDGSNQNRLTKNPANDISPAWSPDGSLIAFASDRNGTWDIYTVHADGAQLRQLTKAQGANTAPSWTGSGKKILFISTRGVVNGNVYMMNADGSGVEQITADSLVKDSPLMATDGWSILVTINTKGHLGIASIALPAKTVTFLTSLNYDSETPVFSPSGDEIMFASDRDGCYNIYAASPMCEHQTRLTEGMTDSRMPSYTATPGVILVAKKGGIYEVMLATGKDTILSAKGDYAPTWHTD